MNSKTCIELFSGSGKISSSLIEKGFESYTFDIRKRKGICTPDFRKDISKISSSEIKKLITDKNPQAFKNGLFVLWLGLPCDVWSYASGSHHWNKDNTPKTEKCKDHLKLLKHVFKLINELNPKYFFIENPRGRLRYHKEMIDFLIKSNSMAKQLTMSSYGFGTQKPTNVFTNFHQLKFKPLDKFGRGNKSMLQFNNLTVNQRQSYPKEFCDEIINQLIKVPGTYE